jgi:hypothetical protein
MSRATGRRPGLVTFAAILMFLLGGFQIVWALTELGSTVWIAHTAYGTFGGYVWLWAILDLLYAAAALYAGFDILRGGKFGQVFGVIVSACSAIRWFFFIPVEPLAAVIIIFVDVLILYGLLGSGEYFGSRSGL